MLIGSPQMIRNASNAQTNILIENKQIQQVNKAKTLGIIIDQHLSWKTKTSKLIVPCQSTQNFPSNLQTNARCVPLSNTRKADN